METIWTQVVDKHIVCQDAYNDRKKYEEYSKCSREEIDSHLWQKCDQRKCHELCKHNKIQNKQSICNFPNYIVRLKEAAYKIYNNESKATDQQFENNYCLIVQYYSSCNDGTIPSSNNVAHGS